VTNSGTISGLTGVRIFTNDQVTNLASGRITGAGLYGIQSAGGPVSVTNSAAITGPGAGITFGNGGTVANQAGGVQYQAATSASSFSSAAARSPMPGRSPAGASASISSAAAASPTSPAARSRGRGPMASRALRFTGRAPSPMPARSPRRTGSQCSCRTARLPTRRARGEEKKRGNKPRFNNTLCGAREERAAHERTAYFAASMFTSSSRRERSARHPFHCR
jgi:hypothetical protein